MFPFRLERFVHLTIDLYLLLELVPQEKLSLKYNPTLPGPENKKYPDQT